MESLSGRSLPEKVLSKNTNLPYDLHIPKKEKRISSDGIKYRHRKPKSEPCEKFVIRFPKGMRAKVHVVANQNRRSMNKEIIARLEHSLGTFDRTPASADVRFGAEEQQEIEQILKAEDNIKTEADITLDALLSFKLQRKIMSLSFDKKRALLAILSR